MSNFNFYNFISLKPSDGMFSVNEIIKNLEIKIDPEFYYILIESNLKFLDFLLTFATGQNTRTEHNLLIEGGFNHCGNIVIDVFGDSKINYVSYDTHSSGYYEPIEFFLFQNISIDDINKKFMELLTEYQNFCEQERIKKMNVAAFDDIILPENFKKDILDDLKAFMNSYEIYKKRGWSWKRGYIFIGNPGNGKTLMLKTLKKAYNLECIDLISKLDRKTRTLEDIFENPRGDSRDKTEHQMPPTYFSIRNLVKSMLKPTLKIYFMEDLDKTVGINNEDFSEMSLHSFLNALDGMAEMEDGSIIITTTNKKDDLYDAILKRPGRFDRIFEFKDPEIPEIVKLLEKNKIKCDEMTNKEIAKALSGKSMAFATEFVKSLTMLYNDNISKDNILKLLERINKHNNMQTKLMKVGFGE